MKGFKAFSGDTVARGIGALTGVASAETDLPVGVSTYLVTPPASGVQYVDLPIPASRAGELIVIRTPTNDSGTVQVRDHNGSNLGGALTAADDYLVVYSDGLHYYIILEVTT